MVIFHMFAKIFSPLLGPKSDFKSHFGLLEVDSFLAKLSKIDLYVLENQGHDNKIENFPMFRRVPEAVPYTKRTVIHQGFRWYASLLRSCAFKPFFSAKTVMSRFPLYQ